MLNENLSWKDHINGVENNTAKNIGLLHHPKPLLNEVPLKTIYFLYSNTYLNYANISWASTNVTKLKKLHVLQKCAVRIVFNKDRLSYLRPLLQKLNP